MKREAMIAKLKTYRSNLAVPHHIGAGFRKVVLLAHRVGIECHFDDDRDCSFERGRIKVSCSMNPLAFSPSQFISSMTWDVAHELGHYLIAPSSRWNRKDYGIPKITADRSERSKSYWDLDEAKAYLVGEHIYNLLYNGKSFKGNPLASKARRAAHRAKSAEAMKWWKAEGKSMVDEVMAKCKIAPRHARSSSS